MNFDAPADRESGRNLALESIAAFAVSIAFLCALSPAAPFTKELGVCESGAVRDVLAGNIILPHYSPGTMVGSPPMYWWVAAAAVRLLGWNEIALRAPSIVATAITSAILYAWLASSFGRRVAMWSVPVLLSTQYIADAARQPRQDSIMMMFLTAALVCLECALSETAMRKRLLAASALAMGGAILTKGPLGIVLPGLIVTIFLASQRRLLELFRLDLILTFAGASALGAIWYLAALRIGGDAFFQFQIVHWIFRRFLGPAVGAVAECRHPFYYYFPRVISGFLPWSLFFPALAMKFSGNRETPAQMTFALCWVGAVLGLFSISAGKCLIYILPLFPALAALIAWLITDAAAEQHALDFWRIVFDWTSVAIAAGVALIVAALAVMMFSGWAPTLASHLHRSDRRFLGILMAAAATGAAGLILWLSLWMLGVVAVFSSFARHRRTMQCAGVATIAVAGTLFWYGFLNPAMAREETLKSFTSVVDRAVPAGFPIDYIGQPDCDLAFYSNHEIEALKNFQCGAESRAAFFLIWQDHLASLAPAQRACLEPLAQSSQVDSHGERVLMIEKK